MEEKKNVFISYLDDDGEKKNVWVVILEETETYVTFQYNYEKITIPYHRILKIKRKEVEDDSH
jgi:uncharacterized protein (UPF0248 family)